MLGRNILAILFNNLDYVEHNIKDLQYNFTYTKVSLKPRI